VKSSVELQAALKAGQRHIEIREHLNLTGLRQLSAQGQAYLLGESAPTTVSLRVRARLQALDLICFFDAPSSQAGKAAMALPHSLPT
jgi:hypothetical protein